MKQYLDILNKVLNEGTKKDDRTNTGTISKFGLQFRHNLQDGFPLLTTKKLHTKSILGELVWFLSGSTSAKELREKYNCTIWDEWQLDSDGNLGKIYSNQWVRWESPHSEELIQIKNFDHSNMVDSKYDLSVPLCQEITNKGELSGNIINSDIHGEFIVLDSIISHVPTYKIQFIDTGFTTIATLIDIVNHKVFDPYCNNIYNVACIGEIKNRPDYYSIAYTIWSNMISSCYNNNDMSRVACENRMNNVFVEQSWHCFANFLRDITQLPYFESWKQSPNDYILDYKYMNSSVYSKQSCIFLDKRHLNWIDNNGVIYIAINKNGKQEKFIDHKEFANKKCLNQWKLSKVILTNNEFKGYTFKKISADNNCLFRKKIIVNQIDEMINQLKNSPDSRRIMLSAWNVGELDKMALPPCHYGFQVYCSFHGFLVL